MHASTHPKPRLRAGDQRLQGRCRLGAKKLLHGGSAAPRGHVAQGAEQGDEQRAPGLLILNHLQSGCVGGGGKAEELVRKRTGNNNTLAKAVGPEARAGQGQRGRRGAGSETSDVNDITPSHRPPTARQRCWAAGRAATRLVHRIRQAGQHGRHHPQRHHAVEVSLVGGCGGTRCRSVAGVGQPRNFPAVPDAQSGTESPALLRTRNRQRPPRQGRPLRTAPLHRLPTVPPPCCTASPVMYASTQAASAARCSGAPSTSRATASAAPSTPMSSPTSRPAPRSTQDSAQAAVVPADSAGSSSAAAMERWGGHCWWEGCGEERHRKCWKSRRGG